MESSKRTRAEAAAARSSAAKKRRVKRGTGTGEGLKVIYGPGCWCGEPFGHDWPGKDEGAPHPRDPKGVNDTSRDAADPGAGDGRDPGQDAP